MHKNTCVRNKLLAYASTLLYNKNSEKLKKGGGSMAYHVLKHIAGITRMTNAQFNEEMAQFGLGAGQQFFMHRIAKYPGLSMAELARMGYYDNCTATRAVKKLVDAGYVRIEPDKKDGRIKRLYATEEAQQLLEAIRSMRQGWYRIVTDGLSEEEQKQLGALLERVADNACRHLEKNCHCEEGEEA